MISQALRRSGLLTESRRIRLVMQSVPRSVAPSIEDERSEPHRRTNDTAATVRDRIWRAPTYPTFHLTRFECLNRTAGRDVGRHGNQGLIGSIQQ